MSTAESKRTELRTQWLTYIKRELDPKHGIPAVVSKRSAVADWASLRRAPSSRAEDELLFAVQIASADYNHPLVLTCVERSLEVIAAGMADERWATLWSATRQIEHGKFLCTGTLASAWLRDGEPDIRAVVLASNEILSGSLEDRPAWTEVAQSEYLYGIQLLLIAGDVEGASAKMKLKKKFNRVQRYFDWHVALLELLKQEDSADDAALRNHFDPYFDEIRDPFFQPPANDPNGKNLLGVALVRLRLALIRWRYIEHQPFAGNWRHIIGQIGY